MPASSCSDPASDALGQNQPSVFIRQTFPKGLLCAGPREEDVKTRKRGTRAGGAGPRGSAGGGEEGGEEFWLLPASGSPSELEAVEKR